jgi:hypothetical protein
MSGVSLETCWAFKKHWNNKFYYRVASCWLFLYDLYYDARIHEHQTKWDPCLFSKCHRISLLSLTARMSEFDPCIHVSEASLEHHLFNLYSGASIRDQISMIDRFISQSVPFGCNPPASSTLGIYLSCLHKYSTPLFVRCHTDNKSSSGYKLLLMCAREE